MMLMCFANVFIVSFLFLAMHMDLWLGCLSGAMGI